MKALRGLGPLVASFVMPRSKRAQYMWAKVSVLLGHELFDSTEPPEELVGHTVTIVGAYQIGEEDAADPAHFLACDSHGASSDDQVCLFIKYIDSARYL